MMFILMVINLVLLDDKELYTIIELLEKKVFAIEFMIRHNISENLHETNRVLLEELEDYKPVCEYLKKWQDERHDRWINL